MDLPTFNYPDESADGDLSGSGDVDCMDVRPTKVIEGWLEKKKHNSIFNGDWQKRLRLRRFIYSYAY